MVVHHQTRYPCTFSVVRNQIDRTYFRVMHAKHQGTIHQTALVEHLNRFAELLVQRPVDLFQMIENYWKKKELQKNSLTLLHAKKYLTVIDRAFQNWNLDLYFEAVPDHPKSFDCFHSSSFWKINEYILKHLACQPVSRHQRATPSTYQNNKRNVSPTFKIKSSLTLCQLKLKLTLYVSHESTRVKSVSFYLFHFSRHSNLRKI